MSKLAMFLITLFFVSSCGTMKYRPYARNVKKMPNKAGIVALKLEHRDEDRQKADLMMAKNCGDKKVEVTEEGEVAVGTVTQSVKSGRAGTQKNVGTLFGIPITSGSAASENTSSTVVQKKEWQITYKCL